MYDPIEPPEWRPGFAVIVALIFVAPAVALAVLVDPVWGPAGYAAVLGPLWLFVHRILTGGGPRQDGS
jgi:hypothetical protein